MLVGTILILVAYWAVVVYIVRSLVVATRQTPKPKSLVDYLDGTYTPQAEPEPEPEDERERRTR